ETTSGLSDESYRGDTQAAAYVSVPHSGPVRRNRTKGTEIRGFAVRQSVCFSAGRGQTPFKGVRTPCAWPDPSWRSPFASQPSSQPLPNPPPPSSRSVVIRG